MEKRLLCIDRCLKILRDSNRLATKARKAAVLAGVKDKILKEY